MQLRNVAIIAHVDHGKTTLVDGLLKQSNTFRANEAAMGQHLIMDSNDQERERGITIMAKNTAVIYKDTKINIVDTPGHADFGGEVERTLHMADGAVLVVDAHEGPMPQTKFVLKKSFELGLKVIVVINKIDKPNARVAYVVDHVQDLFLNLATTDDQLDFPILYAIAREGKAWTDMPSDISAAADLSAVFETIINVVPQPKGDVAKPFQMVATALTPDAYQGKQVLGRVHRGRVAVGDAVVVLGENGRHVKASIENLSVTQGLHKQEVKEAVAGDIVTVAGVSDAHIGDTIAAAAAPEALPRPKVEEPTLKVTMGPNTSPLAGREGEFVTSRQILERIEKELETNVAMKMQRLDSGEFLVSGRGELHLSVFIETLRREGFELQVGKPQVITREIDGHAHEPVEELTVGVETPYIGAVTQEVGRRKGVMLAQEDNGDGSTRLMFEITTRGMLGLRSALLTLSRGTAQISSLFLRWQPVEKGGAVEQLRHGVLIVDQPGTAVIYGLNKAEERGRLFIGPQTEVYEGMVVGITNRDQDIDINVTKEKKLTNVRASGSDEALTLTPPTILSLEQSLDFLEDDELLEVTPKHLRLRKRYLRKVERTKAARRNKK